MENDETTIQYFKKFPLFESLSEEDILVAEEHMYETRLEAGEYLFKEGDQGSFVCFVLDGALEVIKQSSAGNDVSLAELHMGQSIGEMSILDNLTRSASVRSVGSSSLMVMSKKGFELLEIEHPTIAVVMLKHFTRVLSATVREASKDLADLIVVPPS